MQLTPSQQRVLTTLQQEKGGLSAYALLERLRGPGFNAPTQVYRALDRLIERGLVHRLETLNAYITCSFPEGCEHNLTAFAICDTCGRIDEFVATDISCSLETWAKSNAFDVESATIEIFGKCASCSSSQQTGN